MDARSLIVESQVRKLVNEEGKMLTEEFLAQLQGHIRKKIIQACRTHNGGKKKLDATLAIHCGISA
jgi:hypothetical protein